MVVLFRHKTCDLEALSKACQQGGYNTSPCPELISYRLNFTTLIYPFPELIDNNYRPKPNIINMCSQWSFNAVMFHLFHEICYKR